MRAITRKIRGRWGGTLKVYGGVTGARVSTSSRQPVVLDAMRARVAAQALLDAAERIDQIPMTITLRKED